MPILDAAGFNANQAGFKDNATTPNLAGELTLAAASQLLSQAIDRLAADDLGAGRPIWPFAKVTSKGALNPGVSATFYVYGDDGVANNGGPSQTFGAMVNPVIVSQSQPIPVAQLGAGALIAMPPITPGNRKRFYYGYIVFTGGNPTASQSALVMGLVNEDARAQIFVQPSGTPTGHSM